MGLHPLPVKLSHRDPQPSLDVTTEESEGKRGSKTGLKRTESVREDRERALLGHRAIRHRLLVQARRGADLGPAGRGPKARRSEREEKSGDVIIPIGREDGAESTIEEAGRGGGRSQGHCCPGRMLLHTTGARTDLRRVFVSGVALFSWYEKMLKSEPTLCVFTHLLASPLSEEFALGPSLFSGL